MEGKIKFYHPTKGYGFIITEDKKEYFFHVSNFMGKGDNIVIGADVTFEITQGRKGPEATEIKLLSYPNKLNNTKG